jgi:hypothetical protein
VAEYRGERTRKGNRLSNDAAYKAVRDIRRVRA